MSDNLFDALSALHGGKQDRTLLITEDKRHWSRDAVSNLSAQMANVLVAAGLSPGDRCAVQVDKSPEALALYLACLRCGAVFLPLNTAYTEHELQYFIDDATPAVLVVDPASEALGHSLTRPHAACCLTLGADATGTLLERTHAVDTHHEVIARASGDPAAILYTSGTTGRSKGAVLSHGNLSSNAGTLVDHWQFTDADVLLHALPIFHTHGLFVACNIVLISGASMIFLPAFKADQFIEHLPDVTSMMGVPTFYTRLLDDERFTRERVAHMRLFVSGSAPMLTDTHERFTARTGHTVLERYGMTETGMNCSNPYEGKRKPGTVGPSLPGIEVRICADGQREPLPDGDTGILHVRGPNVFQGYWQMPEKTAEELLDDGFFISGDMASRDADGYITIVGRDKDLIISGGYNIYPKEIEMAIDNQPGVLESAVIGVPHPDVGEAAVAVVVAEDTGQTLDEAAVLDAIRPTLARYKQPRRVMFVDELPRNTMGKVQKNQMRKRFDKVFDA